MFAPLALVFGSLLFSVRLSAKIKKAEEIERKKEETKQFWDEQLNNIVPLNENDIIEDVLD